MKDFLERVGKLDPKRLALLAAQLQSRLDAAERARTEPIAIVGMACRFPGGADTPEAFWRLLLDGTDAVREVSPDRWDVDALYDPDPDAPGRMSTRWAGLLDRIDLFDAPFFGISPREAAGMDPQQRLLLELAWEALERAGIAPDGLAGSATGVYVGISGSDYSQLQLRAGLAGMDAYSASGSAHSVAAGRLSFVLGLQGPCFPIDTACSSSLVAVHQAVQSLRAGECGMALAGGVNLIVSPETSIALSKSRMMAPDGRCKAFDARADGFVRGEGGGVLVLKRLSDAEADGDPVVAVIRGSAINQDGRSNGLTAPNGPAQEAVIRAALASGGVEPGQVGYVEAHGTGTSLGDPIEVQAIAAVLGSGRTDPLPIGSVKANLGHLESAAGIAGLVKLVLCLQRREIPAQLHVQSLNPHIPWSALPVRVPTAPAAWEVPGGGTRIGGVSSFGFSGTNAHVVVEEAPKASRGAGEHGSVGESGTLTPERPVHLLALSARSDAALRQAAARLGQHLAEHELGLADVCFTANTGRAAFAHRAALTARTLAELRERLAAVAVGEEAPGGWRGQAAPGRKPKVVFLFTGQGSQHVGMGRTLYETEPTFRAALERCDSILRPLLPRPLFDVLFPAPGVEAEAARLLEQTAFTQPALFAIEWSLAELWRSWGVEPAAVLGHSVGEYVAACVAGVFSLEDGLRLIAERGRLMQALPAGGAMAAVFAEAATVEAAIAPHADRLAVAAINGPRNVVVSGAAEVLEPVLSGLAQQGIQSRRLSVSHAFHSPLVEPVLGAFASAVAETALHAPRIAVISNVNGRFASPAEITDPAYWVSHVRQPVRFLDGIRALHAAGYAHFLEIGPSPTLLGMARDCLPDGADEPGIGGANSGVDPQSGMRIPDTSWLASLRRGRGDWDTLLESLATLHVHGAPIDWRGFDRHRARRRVVLPTYPFERERHWSAPAVSWAAAAAAPPAQPAAGNAEPALPAGLAELLYEVAWLPDRSAPAGDTYEPAAASLLGPAEVAERVRAGVARLSAENGMALYDELLPELDAAAALSIVDALRQLGWRPQVGQHFTTESLEEELRILPRHHRLLRRLLGILEEESVLRDTGAGWETLRVPSSTDPAPHWDTLTRKYPPLATEVTLVARCAQELAGVLRGSVDPLQLLFPGGSLADAEKLYQETPVARTHNALVRDAVHAALGNVPADRTLRVLEVGAGTGGTTACVLPALPPERTEYVFTDVSAHFLGQARQKFERYPFVRYQLLDASREPEAQGFPRHGFDLVVAANVVHATPNLRQTLGNLRDLLAPGGLLVLYEAMQPQRFSDLTVGLTDGWWSFADPELRPDYALLDHRRWRGLLAELGFSDPVTVPDEGAEGVLAKQGLVLARAAAVREEGDDSRIAENGAAGGPHPRLTRTSFGTPSPNLGRGGGAHEVGGGEGPRLVLADDGGTGQRLFDALRERGEPAVLVTAGAAYRRRADDHFELDPAQPSGFERLLAAHPQGVRGAVYLWGLDAALDDETTAAQLMEAQRRAVGGALALVQSLATAARGPAPLWIVTRGAQPAGTEEACAAQASLWGLSHTVALEHPELRCVRIDLDAAAGADEVQALVAALCGPAPAEDQLAIRSGRRLVRRLVRTHDEWSAAPPLRFGAEATYLITGGLRGLGLRVAEWMVERGARNLVLIGRSEPSIAAREVLRRLEAAGARIVVAQADVARRERLAAILEDAERSLPPLRGVVHAAGVLDDGVLLHQEWSRFERVMSPKVVGSWNLHSLTRHRALDFFVLFSSGVGLLGAAGQGNHAAANAFLDALAHHRRGRGLPALSINWGAWSGIGAAADHGLEAQGTRTFTPEQGLRALEWAMQRADSAAAQVAVLAVDWREVLASYPAGTVPPLFHEIARETGTAPRTRPLPVEAPRLLGELAEARPNKRFAVLQAHVRRLAAQVLGVGDIGRIDPQQPLQELGLDSLMAVELRNKLGQAVERTLPATLLFEYPTVAALAAHLAAEVLDLPADGAAPEAPAEESAESIALSEDDIALLLLRKLEHLEAGTNR